MDERDLERLAQGLGTSAAGRLDVNRVADRVVARLRADRAAAAQPRYLRWSRSMALRVAAALAVLVTGGVVARRAFETYPPRPLAEVTVPLLGALSTEELEEVFDSLALDAPVPEIAGPGLESLTEAQLKELLRLMEG